MSPCSPQGGKMSHLCIGKTILGKIYYTPRCEIKDPRNTILHPKMRNKGSTQYNITKLIHRPEKGLNLKSECIVVSAMVHLPQK